MCHLLAQLKQVICNVCGIFTVCGKIQQRCVTTLDCILKLLFFCYIILLLCEVIKIRMTSDTPVIISEQTNILWV